MTSLLSRIEDVVRTGDQWRVFNRAMGSVGASFKFIDIHGLDKDSDGTMPGHSRQSATVEHKEDLECATRVEVLPSQR